MESPAQQDSYRSEPEATAPDRGGRIRSRAVTGLFVLALFYTAYFAKEVFIPVALAVLFFLLLSPLVHRMRRHLRLPLPVGAALVVTLLIGAVGIGFFALSGPAADWVQRLPRMVQDLEEKIDPLRQAGKEVQQAAKEVEKVAEGKGPPGEPGPVPVVVRGPSLTEAILGHTTQLSVGFFITAFLLLFLLASGDMLLRQAVIAAPRLEEKKTVVEIAREIQDDVSHYLVTISLINCGLGVAVGLAMWAAGMPNPVLWGAMATLLNFIPYLGAFVGIAIVALVAFVSFETLPEILLPPVSYLVLTSLEGHVVTPALVARRLYLNPVAVFLALMVWSWMWGVAGALLAVPLLAIFKIVCDHIEGWRSVGVLPGSPSEHAVHHSPP